VALSVAEENIMPLHHLSSRERVRSALRRENHGPIPIDFGGRVSSVSVDVYRELRKKLNLAVDDRPVNDHHYQRLGIAAVADDLLERFHVDTRYVHFLPPKSLDTAPATKQDGSFYYHDEWGVGLRRSPNTLYYDFDFAPLAQASVEDLAAWRGPDFDGTRDGEWEKAIAGYKTGGFAIATVFKGIFEQSWPLRGFEKLLMDMALSPDFVCRLWDKVLNAQKKIYGHFFDVVGPALDIVLITEDLCGQNNPLFSPAFFRKELKPRLGELVAFIQSKCPDAYVGIHSDGAVFSYIQDFIDIGCTILNPLQTTADGMDAQTVTGAFGNKIAFWAGIDTQHLLPFESAETVEREVEAMIRLFSAGSGYLVAPAHNIASGTGVDNVMAMFRAITKVND
jgi:uroporphyrinogen decarboxylase